MTALTADRVQLRERDLRQTSLPVAAGVLIHAGALVAINGDGNATPGDEATGLIGVGVAAARADNSAGSAGDIKVEIRRGAYRFHNSAAADAIARADVGKTAYIVDDQTVALTDGGGTRSPAGKIADVDTAGVWIEFLSVGVPLSATAIQDVLGYEPATAAQGALADTALQSSADIVAALGYEPATAAQGALADTALQSSADIVAALGYEPATAAQGALADSALQTRADVIAALGGTPVLADVNNIGVPGSVGFGVGVCPALPAGFSGMANYVDPLADDYGNYQYTDGSVMVWIPAFYYLWGTGANGLAVNAVSIKPYSAYASVAAANAAGYALHRAFYDGGSVKSGLFVDKYIASNNSGIASSLINGVVLTSAQRGSLATATFASLTGAPSNTYGGAIAAAKTRGANFFCSSRFIRSALALLAYAHAAASTATTYCAWYHATNNFPKGCNNNALGDAQDAAILYTIDGNGTHNTGKTGSANLFSRTTHNGQNCGVADLNGLIWTIEPGLTSDGTNLYILKTSVAMKDATAGNTLATDLWGATGIAALYDDLGTTYGALWATGANRAVSCGNAAQVLSEATSGNAWNFTGLGGPLVGGVGGTNAFGNDVLYDYKPNEMCPLSGGDWTNSSDAGVWALDLSTARGHSSYSVGFRAALYL